MGKVSVLIFQTLDGVIQSPSDVNEDISSGFNQGGWARDYWNEVMENVMAKAMDESHDLLLGRKTYQSFASFFSKDLSSQIGKRMNAVKKFVVTSDKNKLTWQNSFQIKSDEGELAKTILTLKQRHSTLLQVHGSWQLIQFLYQNKLIDEFRLWTFPVVVGQGKQLFNHPCTPETFILKQCEVSTSGVIMHFYTIQ